MFGQHVRGPSMPALHLVDWVAGNRLTWSKAPVGQYRESPGT